MNICNCETCNDKGWIETTVYGSKKIIDGVLVIEKCDECNIFINDNIAAKVAFEKNKILSLENENGFNIKINFSLN